MRNAGHQTTFDCVFKYMQTVGVNALDSDHARSRAEAGRKSPPSAALVSAGSIGVHRSMTDASMSSPEKDPGDWVTGAEPMTGPQRSYLETLAREAGEDVPGDLTKAQASEVIDRLQEKTGRGR
jgi:Protein of unknown function (DUF3072)